MFLSGLLFFYLSIPRSQSNFFIARQFENNRKFCVTNTSFALSWITESTEKPIQQNSIYVPKSRSTFSCDIKNDLYTRSYFLRHPWSLQNGINKLILDERWEEIEVVETKFIERGGSLLNFTPILKIQTNNFNIPLSIRMEKEGHIFLCDGKKLFESNCYWLILQGFNGRESSIQKCGKGEVPYRNEQRISSCMKKVSITHPQFPSYLSSFKWSHFMITKQYRRLTFSLYADHKMLKILEWYDTETPIAITDLIVHSKLVNGFWKAHELTFLYTQKTTRDIELGPSVYAPEGFVCISMYIWMCPFCKIKLSLMKEKKIISDMIYNAENSGWNQIKFLTENVSNETPMQLLVSTISTTSVGYWCLDKIRFCRKEEFRMISLVGNGICQLMYSTDDIVTLHEPSVTSQSNCREDRIEPFCLNCTLLFDNCKRITSCTTDQCVCSAGYLGEYCNHDCNYNTYGHGCRQTCGECPSTCNNIDGTCSSCTNKYLGPKCNKPSALFFANPPDITNITYDGATVLVSDFTILSHETGKRPLHYLIQYKEAENPISPWILCDHTFTFNKPTQFRINKLKPQTKYLVRSLILDSTGQWPIGDHFKYVSFTTACQELTNNNVYIRAYSTRVFITLVGTTDVTCKVYTMSLVEIPLQHYTNKSGTYFDELDPSTKYTLKIQSASRAYKKSFMTTEGVPDKIKGVLVTALTNSSVELKWTAPKLNGNFKHYVVAYQHKSYNACQTISSQPLITNTKATIKTTITISDLEPYSNYLVSVSASNTQFDGEPYTKQITTLTSNTIDGTEVPKILNIRISHQDANIQLTKVNCTSIRGPLTVKLTTKCMSEWCQNIQPKTENRSLPTPLISLKNLRPFSDYQLVLKFSRGNGTSNFSERRSFKTKPTVPGEVKNLLIYTKNGTSISLRWQPPAPPTGILKYLKIVYSCHERDNNIGELLVKPTRCQLWVDFYCVTLSNLKENAQCILTVSARNENPSAFGSPQTIATTTQTEKSAPPSGLKTNWTLENDLVLEWQHPIQTNGDIQYFGIVVSEPSQQSPLKKEFKINNNKYNLTYYYQVDSSELIPTTEYSVTIFPFNGKRGVGVSVSTRSPPGIPALANGTHFESSEDTIRITLFLSMLQGYTDSYRLVVLRSKDDSEKIQPFQDLKGYDLKNLTVVFYCDVAKTSISALELTIGSNQQIRGCSNINNPPLKPTTSYNITLILINSCNGYKRDKIYSYSYKTMTRTTTTTVTEAASTVTTAANAVTTTGNAVTKTTETVTKTTATHTTTTTTVTNTTARITTKTTNSPDPDIPTMVTDPLFHISNHTIGMTMFLRDLQGKTDKYRIIVVRSDNGVTSINFYNELEKFDLRDLTILIDCNFTSIQNSVYLILGQRQPLASCQDINNSLLESAATYNITVILMNTYNNKTVINTYSLTVQTAGELAVKARNTSFFFFALLLLIPVVGVTAAYIKVKVTRSTNRLVRRFSNVDLENTQREDQMLLVSLRSSTKSDDTQRTISGIYNSKIVSVQNFRSYVKEVLEDQELKKQYDNILEKTLMYSTLTDTLKSDYVDMHFSNGLQVKNAYIITQLPTTSELNEFWKIIIDENVKHIVLFAHLQPNQRKHKSYWPGTDKHLHYGDIIIKCSMSKSYTFYTHRVFFLKYKNKIQKIEQIHFSLPPNDTQYLSSLNYVDFFQKMSKIPLSSKSPILVHSSAGMRGVSLALLCDMSLRSAQKEESIDVMTNFRNLLQTTGELKMPFHHYAAAHLIIADTLYYIDTNIVWNSFDGSKSQLFTNEEIQKHLQYLKDTLWLDEIALAEEIPSVDDETQLEGCNVLKVCGFKTPEKFWVTEQPTSASLNDFLKNMHEQKIFVIVTLNDNVDWLSTNHTEIVVEKKVTTKLISIKKLRSYDWITLELTTDAISHTVEVVAFKKWSSPAVPLPRIDDFVNFVIESNEIFQNTKPVLVTCQDGVSSASLYLALSYNIQRIKVEGICDVCTCIRRLRRYCEDFFKNDEQYIFLLEAVHIYMKEFSLYEVR